MDAKRVEKNLRNSSFIIGGAGYKTLHEEIDNSLINELSLLDINNDQAKIGIVYKLFFALIMDDYSLSQIVCAIENTFEDYKKNITKEEVFDLLKACINESYNSLASMHNQNISLQQNIQPVAAPQQQQNPQPNPSEVNMNLGFDITRFLNREPQQNGNVNPYTPNMGYAYQQQQQIKNEQRKQCINNMAVQVKNNIDFSHNSLSFKDIYGENLIDLTAIFWIITDPEIRFQLTNRGVAPAAKFICMPNDDQSFEYKFEVGGRNVYLSTRHMVDSNNNIHFVYKID